MREASVKARMATNTLDVPTSVGRHREKDRREHMLSGAESLAEFEVM
jgi:hypothetical protein